MWTIKRRGGELWTSLKWILWKFNSHWVIKFLLQTAFSEEDFLFSFFHPHTIWRRERKPNVDSALGTSEKSFSGRGPMKMSNATINAVRTWVNFNVNPAQPQQLNPRFLAHATGNLLLLARWMLHNLLSSPGPGEKRRRSFWQAIVLFPTS